MTAKTVATTLKNGLLGSLLGELPHDLRDEVIAQASSFDELEFALKNIDVAKSREIGEPVYKVTKTETAYHTLSGDSDAN